MWRARLTLILLFVACFSLAAWLEPRHTEKMNQGEFSGSVLGSLLGDGRKTVADYFYVQADVYFHSGYYPSIFDQARAQEEQESDISHPEKGEEHEEKGFLGEPRDWIDRFSRNFRPSRHTHLHGNTIEEMLPWMKLSAELDPHRIQTYLVTSYWLRGINKSADAEDFIRDGLRANHRDPDLLYILGEIYLKDYKNYPRAKNILLAAAKCWHERDDSKPEKAQTEGGPFKDYLLLESILGGVIQADMDAGKLDDALADMKVLKANATNPAGIQKQIDALQIRINSGSSRTNSPSRP